MMGFIKRLTDEQVKTFLEKYYSKNSGYSYRFDKFNDSIYVNVQNNHSSIDYAFGFKLLEYDSVGFCSPSVWINYLYKIFKDEYKEAYLEECAKIFN